MNLKLICSVLVLSFLILSCGQKKQAGQQQQGPVQLPVVKVITKTVTGNDEYPVRIEGTINSAVIAKVSGYITNVLVDEGQFVRRGQLLFKLETDALTQDANAAKANIATAEVRVNQLKPLVDQNIISNVELETAKAQLEQAKANYESVVANIGYANIVSPVDGYVGSINYRNGSLVSPTTAQPLTVVSQTDKVYAYFSLPEADYLDFLQKTPGKTLEEKISNFPPVKLKLSNGEIYSEEGLIKRVTAQIDPNTGTISFRATFPNPNHLLANGSSGSILIPKTYTDVPVIPELSSYEMQGQTMVYKVEGDTLATPVSIQEENRIDNNILIKSGLEPGDEIVAEGADLLQGPTPITPQIIPFDSVGADIKTVFR